MEVRVPSPVDDMGPADYISDRGMCLFAEPRAVNQRAQCLIAEWCLGGMIA
jgi:hypothetical protein